MRIISSQSLFSVRCPPHCHFDGRQRSGEISGLNGTSASPPTVISTETEQSGVEWRNLQHQWYQCLPLPLSFRPKRSKAEWSGVEKSPTTMAPVPPPPTCHFDRNGAKRSGVEWRNLRPQWHRPHCGGRSRGSEPQWSSNTLTFLPIRSPARDDRAAYHHFGNFKA